tara:strand:- start:696 stop:1043 length:348 start_codon:yes stop_codon:yes gene_type:complete
MKIRFGEYVKGHRVKLDLTQTAFVKVFNTHIARGRTGKITLAILKQWEIGGGYPNSIRLPALIKTLQLNNLRELMQILEYEATVKFQPVQKVRVETPKRNAYQLAIMKKAGIVEL